MSLDLAYSVNWVLPNNKTRPRTISRSGDKGEDPLALLVRVSVTQFKLSLAVLTDWHTGHSQLQAVNQALV